MDCEYSPQVITKQYKAWADDYNANTERGCQAMSFLTNDQWDTIVAAQRMLDNKESLTLNMVMKPLNRLKAQAKQIEFSLNLAPINTKYNDIEETNAFRMLLSSIMLDDNALTKFSDAFDKCADFGYAVIEVNYDRKDSKTLCSDVVYRVHEDPSIAFFDTKAALKTRVDGRFCGLRREMSDSVFLKAYPKYKGKSLFLKGKKNVIIDYWFRVHEMMDFYLLETGIYKREDLLTEDDKKVIDEKKNTPVIEKASVSRIYFQRLCNEKVIDPPKLFPTDDLPLVYHYMLTFWTAEGYKTLPFIELLKDPQKLFNFTSSQLATAAKNITSDKWLMFPKHVESPRAQQSAKDINTKAGVFIFDEAHGDQGELLPIQRFQGAEVPMSLINLAAGVKQSMDDISGALIEGQSTAQTVVSGVALDKITHNIAFLQAPLFAAHIEVSNVIGRLTRQMIPRIYTEQRVIVVNKIDGSAEAICINQLLATGKIKNNIKDIDDNYNYEITAGPSTTMQKENTLTALLGVYQIAPQTFAATGDIFFRCLETPYSEELSRRASAVMDQDLIKYSMGEITLQDYQDAKKKQQAENMQQQAAMMQNNPQAASAMGIAQAENKKAEVLQFKAQTEREKEMAAIVNNQNKLKLEVAKLQQKAQNDQSKIMIEELQKQIDINNDTIQKLLDASNTSPY